MPTNSNASTQEYSSGARFLYYFIGFILSIVIVNGLYNQFNKKIVKKEYLAGTVIQVIPSSQSNDYTIYLDTRNPPTGNVSHEIILRDPKRIPQRGERIAFDVITYKDGEMEITEAED